MACRDAQGGAENAPPLLANYAEERANLVHYAIQQGYI
jgi:hypothetical protein